MARRMRLLATGSDDEGDKAPRSRPPRHTARPHGGVRDSSTASGAGSGEGASAEAGGSPKKPRTITRQSTRMALLKPDVSGTTMSRERSLRLARLGQSERDLVFKVGGQQVYRVPSLLHVLLNFIIYEAVVKRRQWEVHDLMKFMPYRSFVQRKFFDELERQGFITSSVFRKYLPEHNWMQGETEVSMVDFGLQAPDLYLLRFCLETVAYWKVDLRQNPLKGPAVVCIGPIVGTKHVLDVNLSDTAIGCVGAQTLADYLHDAPNIRVLNVRGCSLLYPHNSDEADPAPVSALLRTLGELPRLVDVDVSDNGIFGARWDKYSLAWVGSLCHDVVAGFAQFLRRNDSLVAVRTASNVLGGFYSARDHLLVDAQPQADFMFGGLCLAGKSLVSLDVSNNGFRGSGSASVAKLLAINETITDLNCSSNALGSRGAATIAAVLGRQRILTRLDLSGNAMGDAGAAAIADAIRMNGVLEYLDLGHNALHFEGVSALAAGLADNDALRTLKLTAAESLGRGVRVVCDALSLNTTLTSLYVAHLGDNHMLHHPGVDVPTINTLCDMLRVHTMLRKLNITKNDMTTAYKRQVQAAMPPGSVLMA